MTWFDILKDAWRFSEEHNALIPEEHKDEPCKTKLEEYNNYFWTQNIQNDTEIKNIYNKYGLTNLDVTSFNDGLSFARHNNRFKGATSLHYMTNNLDKDFLEIPEKVACRFLKLIESVDAGRHSEEMDGYKMYLENEIDEIERDDVWIWENHTYTAELAKAGRYVYRISLNGTIIVEEINTFLRRNDREATNFYSDVSNIIMDKINYKNWK